MSNLSVNQCIVLDLEQRIQRLEAENNCLRNAKADNISAMMLS